MSGQVVWSMDAIGLTSLLRKPRGTRARLASSARRFALTDTHYQPRLPSGRLPVSDAATPALYVGLLHAAPLLHTLPEH